MRQPTPSRFSHLRPSSPHDDNKPEGRRQRPRLRSESRRCRLSIPLLHLRREFRFRVGLSHIRFRRRRDCAHDLSLHLPTTPRLPPLFDIRTIPPGALSSPPFSALLQPTTDPSAALAEPDLPPPTSQPPQPLHHLHPTHYPRFQRR